MKAWERFWPRYQRILLWTERLARLVERKIPGVYLLWLPLRGLSTVGWPLAVYLAHRAEEKR